MTLTFEKRVFTILFSLILCLSADAQLTTDGTLTPEQVVEDILLGTGVQAFNITYSGDLNQVGSFDCNGCGVGINSGVILSSGNVMVAEGPNDQTAATEGGGNGGTNDIDLDVLSTFGTNDAAILEFDFITTGDSVKFNYVFGSEEYNEYVCGSVNDAFGFFLSGPGIAGPFTDNAINLAEVPGTNIPVTINTVNNGTPGTSGFVDNCIAVSPDWDQNTEYYIDNDPNPDPNTIQFDGHTVVLTAAAEVICGETYHIKIAIADGGDTSFDSGVFLQESSFTSSEVSVNLVIADIGVNDSTIYEGCGESYFEFTRPDNGIPDELTFELNLGGDAENGVDYDLIPTTITFPFDVYELQIPFSAIFDGETEGTELVTVSYLSEDACSGNVELQVENFYIQDVVDISITIPDQVIDCGEEVLLQADIIGGYGDYELLWNNGETTDSITVSPPYPGETTYSLAVTDTCGFGPFEQEVIVGYPDYPELTIDAGEDQVINCLGTLDIEPITEGGFAPYTYQWLDGENNEISAAENLSWDPSEAGAVSVIVTDLCEVNDSDTVAFTFPPIPVDVDLGPDLEVTCLDNTTLEANVNGGVGQGGFTYQWNSDGTDLGTDASIEVQVDDDQFFFLQAEDQCGNVGLDSILLAVPPIPLSVDLGPDLDVTCLDITTLEAEVSGGVSEGGYIYQWSSNGANLGVEEGYDAQVDEDQYFFLGVDDQCGNSNLDSILLAVPPVPIEVNLGPDLLVVCVDTSLIDSEVTGGVGDFTYLWELGSDTLGTGEFIEFNTEVPVSISLQVNDECGNEGSDIVEISLPPEPLFLETTADTTVCLGDSLDLFAQASGGQGGYTYLWLNNLSTEQTITEAIYEDEIIEVFAQDICGNSTTAAISVEAQEVNANFDFVYLDDWTIQTYNASTPSDSVNYFWDLGDGNFSYEENPSHTFLGLEPYTITLYLSSTLGCTDSISDIFNPLMDVYVPTAFSPNGDGINDEFFAKGHNIAKFEIWIFNRWGEVVFYSDNINEPWLGEYDSGGHYVKNNTYTYRIKAVGIRGNAKEKTGMITLVR